MSEWIYAPSYQRGEAQKIRAVVETVYEDGNGNYVGVMRGADGRRYTHSVREGSVEDKEKCRVFGVRDLSELQGKSLEMYVRGQEVVGARIEEEGYGHHFSY